MLVVGAMPVVGSASPVLSGYMRRLQVVTLFSVELMWSEAEAKKSFIAAGMSFSKAVGSADLTLEAWGCSDGYGRRISLFSSSIGDGGVERFDDNLCLYALQGSQEAFSWSFSAGGTRR
jgi:hypothetical protein